MSGIISENSIIRTLRERYGIKDPMIIEGIGDDCAVILPKHSHEYLVVTTDMLLEDIDFRLEWYTPRLLGGKAIAVNISDLAAMGARPLFFTISLAVPKSVSRQWVLDFYNGVTNPNSSANARLIGGDLSHTEGGVAISVTAIGESIKRKIVYRRGGRPGDVLYVTGRLGRSSAGLKLLQDGQRRSSSRAKSEAIRAHRSPEARWQVGMWLAQSGWVRCMMDLSDGLSMDLPRLCAASGVGAEVYVENLPVFPECRKWDCDPVNMALNGGEDFELLFAVPRSRTKLLESKYPASFPKITPIGVMTSDVGKIWLVGPGQDRQRMKEQGYDHFSTQS